MIGLDDNRPRPIERSAGDRKLVEMLRETDVFRDYQSSFTEITGLPLVLRPVGSTEHSFSGCGSLNPLCVRLAEQQQTCQECVAFQQRMERRAHSEPTVEVCFAGLTEILVPIILGEHAIAFLHSGQFLSRRPHLRDMRRTRHWLNKCGVRLGERPLTKAYRDSRVVSQPQIEAVTRLLGAFAKHLATVAGQLRTIQSSFVTSTVSRALEMIEKRLHEPITLAVIARGVGMSPYYFCKVFRKDTGVCFSTYIAQRRIDRAKELLLDPAKRISEAAFEAGFNSLSQFNRSFRKYVGSSPKEYRISLRPLQDAVARSQAALTVGKSASAGRFS